MGTTEIGRVGAVDDQGGGRLEIIPSRQSKVGAMTVHRALPRPRRRSIGAWCFADHLGPIAVSGAQGADVGPHPHMGIQTVTWLTQGALLHRDSLGSAQVLRAGELNLMTAGHGVSHAEEAAGGFDGTLEGIQLWLAQPEETRHGPADFQHHADLPVVDLDGGSATVLVGAFDGQCSPAAVATPVVDGALELDGEYVAPGQLGVLPIGRDELRLDAVVPARAMLLGGVPFGERLAMWWNFVGRDAHELEVARASWVEDDGRFGTVESRLARAQAPPPRRPAR